MNKDKEGGYYSLIVLSLLILFALAPFVHYVTLGFVPYVAFFAFAAWRDDKERIKQGRKAIYHW
jgi:hypothetical protein